MDINEVRLMGRVTNDPTFKAFDNSNLLSFGLATNQRYQKDGEWINEPTYHNITIWGVRDGLKDKVVKGVKLHVAGRISVRSWDGADGKKNYKTEIVADRVIVLEDSKAPQAESSSQPAPNYEPNIEPQELPF